MKESHPVQTYPIPAYVDPAVLEPGAHIRAVLGDTEQILVVLRVEPAIIARAQDGTDVVLLAHMCVPVGAMEDPHLRVVEPKEGPPAQGGPHA